MLNRTSAAAFVLASVFLSACSSEDVDPNGNVGTGGVVGTGGGVGTGGVVGTGGGVGTGGASSGGASTGGSASGGAGTGGEASGGAGTGGEGTGGDSGTGGAPSTESAGCEMPANEAKGSWVGTSVNVGGGNRDYDVRLPTGYDPSKAYPIIMLLHGCGSYTNNVPMENAAGSEAILIRGEGSRNDGCWLDTPTGNDMDYIDAMLEDVKLRFCADTAKVFAVGYSSGSWVINQLSCVRADVFRGLASVTGGEPPLGQCSGDPVARIFIHDANDNTNLIAWSRSARDRMLGANACDSPAATSPYSPDPCVSYNGCDEENPLVWCQTSGQGHGRQDNFAPGVFWNFFKSLETSAP